MNYKEAVSPSIMCCELQKQNLTRKKKTIRSSQSPTEIVQIYMCEFWKKVKIIDPNNLIFYCEMGVLLGLTRTHAHSKCGSRVYDLKPFYPGAKITVIGARSLKKVVGMMTIALVYGWQGIFRFC